MERTGSNALVMDLYALTIIKQGNVNFGNVSTVDAALKGKVIQHQDTARGNAKQWLDVLKPQLISTNQNIINYNTKFQNYYDTLVAAVDAKDKATLTKGLTRLSSSINENKAQVDQLVEDLKKFRNKMTSDTQNFKGDANQITSILASQDAGIPLLQNQITTYNEAISKYNAIIIGSSVATALECNCNYWWCSSYCYGCRNTARSRINCRWCSSCRRWYSWYRISEERT